MLYYKLNTLIFTLWFVEFSLLSPKEVVAHPLPKHLLFDGGVLLCNCYQVLEGGCSCLMVEFSCATVTKSLKEAVAV